jgi:hypothetical protein
MKVLIPVGVSANFFDGKSDGKSDGMDDLGRSKAIVQFSTIPCDAVQLF